MPVKPPPAAAHSDVLLQLIDRRTKQGIHPIVHRVVPRLPGESNPQMEFRVKEQYATETFTALKYQPALRRSLANHDWCVDCTVV